MKREAGDGPQGGGPMKRTRGGDGSEIRLLIPSKVAGSIIGKGGHNISKLRTELNASVTIPDCPGPERIFAVSADLETMLNVITEILPNLEDFQGNSRGRRHDGGGSGGDGEVDIRMMVHQSQAGCIIGKAGSKIKELRDKTGARIKIYSSCCPQSTDRIVQINGKGKLCVDAIRECVELLKTSPIKGMSNPYDPHNFDEYYAGEYGGYGGGGGGNDDRRGGGSGRGGPPSRGGGSHRNDDDYGGRGNYGGGNRGGGGGGRGGGGGGPMGGPMGNGMPPGGNAGNYGPPSFGGGGGPSYGGPPSMGGGGGGGEKTSTQVTIPKDLAGAIIGKGGTRIRKIRMDSGAGITIDEPLPGSNDRIITITGTANQIQMAQYLLQQSVRDNSSNY